MRIVKSGLEKVLYDVSYQEDLKKDNIIKKIADGLKEEDEDQYKE
ncbi:hypothetical protein [Wolbachia endosymbiont of Pentidionis agamae]